MFFTHTARHPEGWVVLRLQARTHGEPFAAGIAAMRAEIVEFVTRLILVAAREAHRDPVCRSARSPGSPRPWSAPPSPSPVGPTPPPGVPARRAAATLMNFARASLGDLMEDRPWTPPAGDLTAPTALT